MKYRLIALDLDGTLLGPDHRVSDENRAAIVKAQEAGVIVVPCTGRGWRESIRSLAGVEGLSVGIFNTGAAVVEIETGRAVDLAAFEPHVVLELIDYLRDLPEAVLVYQEHGQTGRDYLVTGDGQLTDNTKRWFEMNGILSHENRRPTLDDLHHSVRVGVVAVGQRAFDVETQVIERFGDRVSLHCFAGVPTTAKEEAIYIVEIFAAGVNKWRGVSWLAEQHGIPPEAVAAVGDEVNDLAMLEHAGLGVAMGNAVDRARDAADVQTLPHHQHGVAHAIRQMLDGVW